ncbi:hypothetical protein TRICHSKD4_4620 [Roseibium sp. TrichSKD4]|nr:hypothetical protein TRICHSKD4_4620 [Roseibium sp. TrichSKD4]
MTVFTDVCNSDGSVVGAIIDFDGYVSAVFELFVDFIPFGLRQDTAVEPHVWLS